MPVTDIVFTGGEVQNYILELPSGTLHSPTDILSEANRNASALCFESESAAVATTLPEIVFLSDGKLAKRINESFYLKLP